MKIAAKNRKRHEGLLGGGFVEKLRGDFEDGIGRGLPGFRSSGGQKIYQRRRDTARAARQARETFRHDSDNDAVQDHVCLRCYIFIEIGPALNHRRDCGDRVPAHAPELEEGRGAGMCAGFRAGWCWSVGQELAESNDALWPEARKSLYNLLGACWISRALGEAKELRGCRSCVGAKDVEPVRCGYRSKPFFIWAITVGNQAGKWAFSERADELSELCSLVVGLIPDPLEKIWHCGGADGTDGLGSLGVSAPSLRRLRVRPVEPAGSVQIGPVAEGTALICGFPVPCEKCGPTGEHSQAADENDAIPLLPHEESFS